MQCSQNYATEVLRCHVPGTRYAVSTAVGNCFFFIFFLLLFLLVPFIIFAHNAMPCHDTTVDTTGTTYTFYEIEKRKGGWYMVSRKKHFVFVPTSARDEVLGTNNE